MDVYNRDRLELVAFIYFGNLHCGHESIPSTKYSTWIIVRSILYFDLNMLFASLRTCCVSMFFSIIK